jgi:hypothetical protein
LADFLGIGDTADATDGGSEDDDRDTNNGGLPSGILAGISDDALDAEINSLNAEKKRRQAAGLELFDAFLASQAAGSL